MSPDMESITHDYVDEEQLNELHESLGKTNIFDHLIKKKKKIMFNFCL